MNQAEAFQWEQFGIPYGQEQLAELEQLVNMACKVKGSLFSDYVSIYEL